jgi:hypothetical protein
MSPASVLSFKKLRSKTKLEIKCLGTMVEVFLHIYIYIYIYREREREREREITCSFDQVL